MKIGVVKTSCWENERRVPLYPEHLLRIPETLRRQMVFERDYGRDYGCPDDYFIRNCCGMLQRHELIEQCDLLIFPKPVAADLRSMRPGQVIWGWMHCVQQRDIAQAAIDRRLTLIAWEAMHHWGAARERLMHIFYKNNELAGYAAILHVLQLLGVDGHYGPRRLVTITGYGSVSRGAIYALQGRGFNNIRVYTRRPTHLVADQNPDVYYHHFCADETGALFARLNDGTVCPLLEELAQADIIVNGVLQDVNNPLMFVRNADLSRLKRGSIIVDVSCDRGMGFEFARPTTFDAPLVSLENAVSYYSVDHTPTYLWNAASREISRAVIPFLEVIAQGPQAWEESETVRRAVEIQDGMVRNRDILSFQRRAAAYPYEIRS